MAILYARPSWSRKSRTLALLTVISVAAWIAHGQKIFTVEPGREIPDLRQIDEFAPVGAKEGQGCEFFLQAVQGAGAVVHVLRVARVHEGAAPFRADEDDIGVPEQQHAPPMFHGDAYQRLAEPHAFQQLLKLRLRGLARVHVAQLVAQPSQAVGQAFAGDGLEQIIHRVLLESADGILVVGRGKDEERRLGTFERPLQNMKAGRAGHLDVLKDHFGAQSHDFFHGLRCGHGRADDLHILKAGQKIGQFVQGGRFVIDKQAADRRCHGGSHGVCRAFIRIVHKTHQRCNALY